MKLDELNNKFLINALKLYIKDNIDFNPLIIIGYDYNKYIKNIDDSIKIITNIYNLKISDFNSKIIICINDDKELNKCYDTYINKKEYNIVSKIEKGLKLYIQE